MQSRCPCWVPLLAVALTALFAAGPGEARWSSEFVPVEDIFIDDGIVCLASYHDRLVIGGCFGRIGARELSKIALRDGESWQPIGDGLSNEVYGALEWQGRLIVAGREFSPHARNGKTIIRAVAAWDGSEWTQLGTGLQEATRLVVWRDHLVAGGVLIEETSPQGSNAAAHTGVAVLEGNRWSELGRLPESRFIVDLAACDGDLFAITSNRVAMRWTGTEWVPGGPDSSSVTYRLLATRDGLAAMISSRESKPEAPAAEIWELPMSGAAWRPLEVPGAGLRFPIGTWRGRLVLTAGREHILLRTGAGWDSLALPFPGSPIAAQEAGGSLWLLLGRTLAGGQVVNQVTAWDGQRWTAPEGGLAPDEPISALLSDGDRLIAAGWFARFGPRPIRQLAVWDGRDWAPFDTTRFTGEDSTVGQPFRINALQRWRGALLAIGAFHTHRPGHDYMDSHLLATWDGLAWRPFGSEPKPWLPAMDRVARTATETPAGLVVGGQFSEVQDRELMGIGLWDGDKWNALGDAPGCPRGDWTCAPGFDESVPFAAGVVAAGPLIGPDGKARSIGFWNGAAWDFMDDGVDGQIADMILYEGSVIAGGSFLRAGTVLTHNVAAWNGERWSALGDGLADQLTTLGQYRGHLIAATLSDPRSAANASRSGRLPASLWTWTGSAWVPFEGGAVIQGEVRILCEHAGDLFVAGDFGSVNGIPSMHLARWTP